MRKTILADCKIVNNLIDNKKVHAYHGLTRAGVCRIVLPTPRAECLTSVEEIHHRRVGAALDGEVAAGVPGGGPAFVLRA